MCYNRRGTKASTTLFLPSEAASALPFFCATPVRPLHIPYVDWTRSQGYDTLRCSDIAETARKPDLPYNYCCSTALDTAFAPVRLYLRSQWKAELSFKEERQKESRI